MFLVKRENYQWIILLIATFSQACATFVTYGIGPLAAFYQREHHLSQFEVGLLVSAVNIGPIFSMLFFGDLMDKHGEKWVVGLGSVFLGLSILSASLTNQYTLLLFILAFVGLWYGTAQPGGSSAIMKWFPQQHRGLAMGIRQTGIPLGGAAASAVLPFFFHSSGLIAAITVQGTVAIIGGIIFLLFYKDVKQKQSQTEKQRFIEKLNKIKSNSALYPVFFIGMIMVSLQIIIIAHFMSYFTNTLHVKLSTAGSFLSFALAGGMFGRIILAWISDRVFKGNRSKPLQLTMLASALAILGLIFLPPHLSSWGISLLSFWIGFLGIGWFSLFVVLVSEKSNPHFATLTVSFALTLNQLWIMLSPSLFGWLVDYFSGYTLPLLLLAFFVLTGAAWLWISERHYNKKADETL
ncbi:MFS transporter [Pseudobacillus wudalianchiensis]|uniref:MFS transporter n=1 Tax=Pseudobacillus wudalianchiensis TaxID=1743143 RepID=A0A1B9ABT2_9BACI|nr:MFS transporter [Bacillus wudalianchiensis]OCA81303.1 MFS transporter [Bacillus wudalianchiensis]